FGIGRYLYRLEAQWMDYDPQKKKIIGTPRLPASALPQNYAAARLAEAPPAPEAPSKPEPAARAARARPASGEELKERLTTHRGRLAGEGVCKAGELLRHVQAAGEKAGHGKDMTAWSAAAIELAIEETRSFEAAQRKAREPAAKAG